MEDPRTYMVVHITFTEAEWETVQKLCDPSAEVLSDGQRLTALINILGRKT